MRDGGTGPEWDRLSVVLAGFVVEERRLLRGVMAPWGVRDVREAKDGARALYLLAERRASLVMAEIEMAPLDGMAMLALLRGSKDSPDTRVPVLLLSSRPTLADVLAARAAGSTLILARPFSALALYERIDALVHRPPRRARPPAGMPLSAGLLPPA
ncbi:MAG: response regulator [Alphaproteobacteria bacterium]|nr:response regulator [Alphaproteobacteria bacterium]